MGFIQRLNAIWNTDKSYAIRYMIVFVGSIFVHTVLALLFALFQEPLCVWMNVISILVFILWLYAFSCIRITSLLLLVPLLDLYIHTCIYNLSFGAGPAFYLYTFATIPVSFFLPVRDAKVKNPIVIAALLAVIGVLSTMATLANPPAAVDSSLSSCFFQVNLITSSLLLGTYIWEFLTETNYVRLDFSHTIAYDQLTGLRNRSSLNHDAASIHGTQYCVIMCDLDNFRDINNTYGHSTGDTMLSLVGSVLHSCLRREDLICRWSSDRFLLVIRSDMEAARTAVERIRRKLMTTPADAGGESVFATMTFGIADCLEENSFEKVVAIAENNMMQGKHCGKNCVFTSASKSEGFAVTLPEEALDISNLDAPIFSAFAATSDTTYLYICNLETNVSRWSRSAVDYFGLPGEYIFDAGNIWLGYVHPEDRDAYAQDIEMVFSGKKRLHDVTYRARNKNGEYVTCVCKGVVTEGGADHPPFFAGTMTNLGKTAPSDRVGK